MAQIKDGKKWEYPNSGVIARGQTLMEVILKYLLPAIAIHMNLFLMNMPTLSVKTMMAIMRVKVKDWFML